MGIIIYGETTAIISLDEFFVKCPSCEAHKMADVMIKSNYYHFYYIPIFPFDKHVNIICQTCGLKRYGLPFDSSIIPTYSEVKHKYHHPFYTYTGIAIISFIILTGIILSFIK